MTEERKRIDPDDFAITEEMARTLGPRPKDRKGNDAARPVKRPAKGKVVVVPHSWRLRLVGTTRVATWPVAHHLLDLDWKAMHRPFKVTTSGLAEWGVNRQAKWDALTELEGLGLIQKEDGGPGKNPTVTILVR